MHFFEIRRSRVCFARVLDRRRCGPDVADRERGRARRALRRGQGPHHPRRQPDAVRRRRDPRASMSIDRADITKMGRSDDVVTITTRRTLGDRDAFRFRLAQPADSHDVVRRDRCRVDVAGHAGAAGPVGRARQLPGEARPPARQLPRHAGADQCARGVRVERHHQRLARSGSSSTSRKSGRTAPTDSRSSRSWATPSISS